LALQDQAPGQKLLETNTSHAMLALSLPELQLAPLWLPAWLAALTYSARGDAMSATDARQRFLQEKQLQQWPPRVHSCFVTIRA